MAEKQNKRVTCGTKSNPELRVADEYNGNDISPLTK